MQDIFMDTLFDSIKTLPFLFFAFLLVEFLEHKMNDKIQTWIQKSGKYGPIIGSSLGILPQCGFSVAATNLYITRIISFGTLIAIYLSTSDEMLPILLSKNISFSLIFYILFFKWIVGIAMGCFLDFILGKKRREHIQYELCTHDCCDCEHESIFISSLKHTGSTFLFLFCITFGINILFTYYGEEWFSKFFLKGSIFAPFLSSFIGLIPSCGSSILLTELYVEGAIPFSSCIAGLLTGSGAAFLILFKSNKNKKENVKILSLVYFIGAGVGLLLEILAFFFGNI